MSIIDNTEIIEQLEAKQEECRRLLDGYDKAIELLSVEFGDIQGKNGRVAMMKATEKVRKDRQDGRTQAAAVGKRKAGIKRAAQMAGKRKPRRSAEQMEADGAPSRAGGIPIPKTGRKPGRRSMAEIAADEAADQA